MIQSKSTWKRRWKILALLAVLCIGIATLTDAQERRKAAEIQAEIETLQAELREAQEAEGIMVDENEPTAEFYPVTEENRMFIVNTLSFLVPNVRSSMDKNRFAVIGTKAEHEKIKEMLAKLQKAEKEPEQNVAPEWARKDDIMCAYSLNGINKEKALRLLSSLKGLLMKLDEERNMLLVFGSEVMHSNVKELLGQVATEPAIQPLQPLIPTDEQVGHRPPGGAVGESRPEPDTFNSSAEYRTLPPGGRQPTSQEPLAPYTVIRQIPEQVEEILPSGEKVVKTVMKEVVETIDPTARQLIPIEEEMAKQRDPFFDRDSWQRQPAPPQEELVFRTYTMDSTTVLAFLISGVSDKVRQMRVANRGRTNQDMVFHNFVLGSKSSIEKIDAVIAQLKESQESEEKAIAANKPILRSYEQPNGVPVSELLSFITALIGKNGNVITHEGKIAVWALQPDQDKVSAMLEQITQATEKGKAAEDSEMQFFQVE